MNPLFNALSQTWPARAIKDAIGFATAPKRAYTGELQMWDPETGHVSDAAVEAGTGMAGLAMTGGLGGLGGMSRQGVVGSGPIRAYHGSPHDFDRFDLSKIGTGEGAQAYGHGLYFAENERVARAYRDALSQVKFKALTPLEDDAVGLILPGLQRAKPEEAAALLDKYITNSQRIVQQQPGSGEDAVLSALQKLKANGEFQPKSSGKMYEVAIHADPERFLDWDAPLMRQHEDVRRAIENHPQARRLTGNDMVRGQLTAPTGEAIINRAAARTPEGARSLAEAGIPGIKYLDQGSRPLTGGEVLGVQKGPKGYQAKVRVLNRTGVVTNTPADMVTTSKPYATEAEALKWAQDAVKQGTRNYVTFSDNIVEILRKYGLVGGLGGLGGMQAMQEPRT